MKNNLIKNFMLGAILFVPGTVAMNHTTTSAKELENINLVTASAVTAAEQAVATAEGNASTTNIQAARTLVNALPEGADKERLQTRLNALINITDIDFPSFNVSANVDVYIKCENLLSLSLDTNKVNFNEYGGTEDLELLNAVTLTVTSSLPYDVNAYLPVAIKNEAGTKNIDISVFKIRANGESAYKDFTSIGEAPANKVNLLTVDTYRNNGKTHGIDLKLTGGSAHDADVYKTTVKFEVAQK